MERKGEAMNRARPIRIDKPALRDLSAQLAAGVRTELKKLGLNEREPIDDQILGSVIVEIPTVRGEMEAIRIYVMSELPPDVYSATFRKNTYEEKERIVEHQVNDTIVARGSLSLDKDPEGFRNLMIFLNGVHTPRRINAKGKLEDALFSVLIHEATHGAEAQFLPRSPYKELPHDFSRQLSDEEQAERFAYRQASYYNAPTELRAYGQQIADDVLSATAKDPTTITDAILQEQIGRSRMWKRIAPYLTPESANLVYRMVWRTMVDRIE
jgi:hypothetical protein